MHRCRHHLAKLAYERRHRELFAWLAYAALEYGREPTTWHGILLRTWARRLHRHECQYSKLDPHWLNERELDLWNAAMGYCVYGIGCQLLEAALAFGREPA
jgi:hypothetical protein